MDCSSELFVKNQCQVFCKVTANYKLIFIPFNRRSFSKILQIYKSIELGLKVYLSRQGQYLGKGTAAIICLGK